MTEQTTAQNDTDAAVGSGVDTAAAGAVDTAAAGQPDTAGADTSLEGTAATDQTAEGGDDAATGAPEQYEAFQYPDGYEVDEAALAEFTGVVKALNLTQAQAQQLIDFDAQRYTVAAQQADAQMTNLRAQWKSEIAADAEIGGAKYDQSMVAVAKTIDAFGSPTLRTFLNESGLGDHPEVVRLLAKVGDAISEDRLVSGEGNRPSRRFYDNSTMN